MSNKIIVKESFDDPGKPPLLIEFDNEFRTVKSLVFNSLDVEDSTKILRFEGLKLKEKK